MHLTSISPLLPLHLQLRGKCQSRYAYVFVMKVFQGMHRFGVERLCCVADIQKNSRSKRPRDPTGCGPSVWILFLFSRSELQGRDLTMQKMMLLLL